MGKERNKPLAERDDKPLRYYDREVCKYNLCGLCPNMLFTNTKSYLGEQTLAMNLPACCCCCCERTSPQQHRPDVLECNTMKRFDVTCCRAVQV